MRYGVFGLGDRTYAETFNFGGKRFDDLLAELGAQRIGERVQHDASSGVLPEEMAEEWGEGWLALAKEASSGLNVDRSCKYLSTINHGTSRATTTRPKTWSAAT